MNNRRKHILDDLKNYSRLGHRMPDVPFSEVKKRIMTMPVLPAPKDYQYFKKKVPKKVNLTFSSDGFLILPEDFIF